MFVKPRMKFDSRQNTNNSATSYIKYNQINLVRELCTQDHKVSHFSPVPNQFFPQSKQNSKNSSNHFQKEFFLLKFTLIDF